MSDDPESVNTKELVLWFKDAGWYITKTYGDESDNRMIKTPTNTCLLCAHPCTEPTTSMRGSPVPLDLCR